jgi:dTDP-4-amino-4,6-dideoxygalactose transaminase
MGNPSQPFIVFGQPRLSEEEIQAVVDVLRSGWIGTGPKSKEFEKAFAEYQGVSSAVGVSSCTSALTAALRAYGIGKGDEVITTAMTFAATVSSIVEAGAKPVLVDTEVSSRNIDVAAARAAITPRTKAIIPVHFAGAPCDIDALLALRSEFGVKIIHDCAHAIETEWRGKRLSAYADATCFSFYSTKNITSIEGGMICSQDQLFVERARLISNHGMSKDAWKRFSTSGYQHYDVVAPGFKFNLTDVQSALGLAQLRKIDAFSARRRELWDRYQAAFTGTALILPADAGKPHRHALHLYSVLVDPAACGLSRDEMLTALQARGIGCGVHYRAIPSLTHFRETYGWKPENFPNAVYAGDRTLSIPLTPYLTDEEAGRVIAAVQEVLASAKSRAVA